MKNQNRYSAQLFFILINFILFFISCATPYQRAGFSGGYSELQVKRDIWKVFFSANAFTSMDTVQTYLIYRCAELTLENNKKYFVVLSLSSNYSTYSYKTPIIRQGEIKRDYTGNYKYYEVQTGGETYSFNKPYAEVLIYMFTELNESTKDTFKELYIYDAKETINLYNDYIEKVY